MTEEHNAGVERDWHKLYDEQWSAMVSAIKATLTEAEANRFVLHYLRELGDNKPGDLDALEHAVKRATN
jgi:hypothetical protein